MLPGIDSYMQRNLLGYDVYRLPRIMKIFREVFATSSEIFFFPDPAMPRAALQTLS